MLGSLHMNVNCLTLQENIDAVNKCSEINQMDFDVSKGHMMYFSRRQKQVIKEDSKLENSLIIKTSTVESGYRFYHQLTCHEHNS